MMERIFSQIQMMRVTGDDETLHTLEYTLLSEIHFAYEEVSLSLLPFVQQLCV